MVIVFYPARRQDQHSRNPNLFNKGRIMADHYYCAGKVTEIVADNRLGVGVKMICRFVQYQHVAAL